MWTDILGFLGGIAASILCRIIWGLLDYPRWFAWVWGLCGGIFLCSPLGHAVGVPVCCGIVAGTLVMWLVGFMEKERRRRDGEWVE